jgi:glycerophosphoryl diester phosphodiesterase
MIPSLDDRAWPLRIGHMGAAGLAPANSLEAIETALRVGVDLVELDVWRTVDDHLALAHFNWLDPEEAELYGALARPRSWVRTARTWRQWPRITQNTLEELRSLPMRVASLDEALDLMRGRAIPYLDLRSTGIAERLCSLLQAAAPDGAILSAGPQRSFLPERTLMPSLGATSGVALPFFGRALSAKTLASLARASIGRARRMGATGLSVQQHLIRPPFLAVCREAGFFVFAWTVDDPIVMRHLAALGVDGITTNRPDLLAAVLARG